MKEKKNMASNLDAPQLVSMLRFDGADISGSVPMRGYWAVSMILPAQNPGITGGVLILLR